MKQIIKKAARVFQEQCRIANFKSGLDYPYDDMDMVNAFEEGARYAQRWISVDDRETPMPNDEDIIIRLQDGSVRRYCEEWEDEFGLDGIVTHWMPIPEFN